MVLRVGIADHLGWAVAVTASADHEVVDRRRIDLVREGLSAAPIHYDRGASDDATIAALIKRVRLSIVSHASDAFDDLAAALPALVTSISLREWSPNFPTDLAVLRQVPWEARADAVMYRQVLAEVAEARGWAVHLYDAKSVEAQATKLLGPRADDVLTGPRARLGPPWTKDHRQALAATVVASNR
jgi:hypothetical protein